MDIVRDPVAELVRRERDALEAICERMLVDPRGWGVLVTVEGVSLVDGTYSAGITYELSPDVPFGQIHERGHLGWGMAG